MASISVGSNVVYDNKIYNVTHMTKNGWCTLASLDKKIRVSKLKIKSSSRRSSSQRSIRKISKRKSVRKIKRSSSRRSISRRSSIRKTSRRSSKSPKSLEFDSTSDMMDHFKELGLGNKIAAGRDGIVYEFGADKVIKFSKEYKSMGPVVLKRYQNETKISKMVSDNKIGPKLYDYGMIKIGSNTKVSYMILEKLYPLNAIPKVNRCELQADFVKLFVKLSKLKIYNKDPNPANIMLKKSSTSSKDGSVYHIKLIDFGRAVFVDKVDDAMERNIRSAIMMAFPRLYGSCDDCTDLIHEFRKHCNEENRKFLGIYSCNINGKMTKIKDLL